MPVVTLPILKSSLSFSCDWHILVTLLAVCRKEKCQSLQRHIKVAALSVWKLPVARVHECVTSWVHTEVLNMPTSEAEACLLSASPSPERCPRRWQELAMTQHFAASHLWRNIPSATEVQLRLHMDMRCTWQHKTNSYGQSS